MQPQANVMKNIAISHATCIASKGTWRFNDSVPPARRRLPPLDAVRITRATGRYTTVANLINLA